jgi:hypothetical protein
MGPDLRNVITVTEAGEGPGPRIVMRHRAFPEAQAEGKSPREALQALQSVLKRSAAWTTDVWHTADLARALFDVESLLRLLDCPDRAMFSGGHHSKVIKEYDTVYYLTCCPDEDAAVPANGGDDRPGYLEPRGVPAPTPTILIYSLGRRRGARRRDRNGQEPSPGQQERSPLDRRRGDRRRLGRMSLIAEIPLATEPFAEAGMEAADLPPTSR